MDGADANRLRRQIAHLQEERGQVETSLLEPRKMLRASFIVRYLGTSTLKRRTPSFYLSLRRNGKTVLKYVSPKDRSVKEPSAKAWGEYRRLVAKWLRICRQLEKCWRALAQAQAESPLDESRSD